MKEEDDEVEAFWKLSGLLHVRPNIFGCFSMLRLRLLQWIVLVPCCLLWNCVPSNDVIWFPTFFVWFAVIAFVSKP